MYLNGPKIAQAEPHRHLRCWASFSPTSWCTEALGEESPSNGMWHREPGENPSYFSWLKWQYSLPLLQQCILTLKLAFRNSDISEVCPCLQVCPGLPFFFFFFQTLVCSRLEKVFQMMPKRHCKARMTSAFSVTPFDMFHRKWHDKTTFWTLPQYSGFTFCFLTELLPGVQIW